jgi:hypothetical protein
MLLPPALGLLLQAHGKAEKLGKIEYRQCILAFLAGFQIGRA